MAMMNRFYLFSFLLFTLTIHSQELHFENIELKGLPSTETYQVFQDSRGIIWISTDAGICKYDGNTTTTYTIKEGISENVVLRIYEDYKHRIWFTTVSGYVFYFENGRFTQIAACEELKELSKPFTISNLFVGENDTLYTTVLAKYGLIKIPPEHNYQKVLKGFGTFSAGNRYLLSNKIKPNEQIVGTGLTAPDFKDSVTTLFFDDTIISLSLKKVQGYYYTNGLINVKKSKNGTIYSTCRNQISVIQKSNHQVDYYYFPDDILNIIEDRDGDVWVCVQKGGCYLYKKGDLKSKPLISLNHLSVTSVTLDREGSVWASTLEKGIFQCMNKYVFTFPEIVTDFKIKGNQLNIALFSKKEMIISNTDSINYRDVCGFLPEKVSLHSISINDHSTYYSTSQGLYNVENKSFTSILYEKKIHIPAKHLVEIDNDTVIAVSTGSLIFIYHNKAVRGFSRFLRINVLVQLANKKILIGSRSNDGIFELKNNAFVPYLGEFKQLKTRINCILEDKNGNLWIATNEKGIYCYNAKTRKLYEFNEGTGLISNKVNSCTTDVNGNIWCGTHKGLSKLIASQGLAKLKIENFNKNHGVEDLEINNIVSFNGKIWCAGKASLFYFDPDHMKKNNVPPGLSIESLQVENKNTVITDSLLLNYDQNDFRIQYNLISHKKTDNRSFLYKLNGYDKNWNLSNTGDIQYTNIHFGTYTLFVYGLNNDGVRSRQPLLITFVIEKPFWLTWWFILLEISIIFIIIYFSIHYWKHKIEKKEREKASINQEISEFKMTALRSQMNPHFIFNAIGSIQHYILKNEIKQSYNYLSKFSMLIRNILNNSRQEYISLTQEINTLRLYIELEQIRFTHPFQFKIEIDEALDMEMDIPTMLIQPYVENSIWHGLMPKESDGILELIFKKVGDSLQVIIRDNGMGRKTEDPAKKHVSKGMSITEQRIHVLATTNKKKFITTIMDLKSETGDSRGTEVNLIIPFDL
jgi:hypothetical protein